MPYKAYQCQRKVIVLAAAFLDLKHTLDKKLDDLFTSDMFMLADGYAGATTISGEK